MNSVPKQLAMFAGVLVVLFSVGMIVGQLLDADAPGGDAHSEQMDDMARGSSQTAQPVRGLTAEADGLKLTIADPDFTPGKSQELRFVIVDDKDQPVTDFDVTHTKRMHLIVVRRDLTGFQHLHPTMEQDGTWTTALTLPEAGQYRVFADFSHNDSATTLAGDLTASGSAESAPLPAAETNTTTDGGYDVSLSAGDVQAAEESNLTFNISKAGEPVETEPYLGAGGHLVALREGDLAFLHVHPVEGGMTDSSDHQHGHESASGSDALTFAATFPTAGNYRLFLQFKVDGEVETASFTLAVPAK